MLGELDFKDQDEPEVSDEEVEENGFGIVLSDTLTSLLSIVITILVILLMIPHSEIAKVSDSKIGALCAELSWPDDRNIDLDLWGHSPGDSATVGYTNMHGEHLNLLKDVVGFSGNPTHIMLEIQCADEVVPGEWIFNVHYFANHEDSPPSKNVKATMIVRVRPKVGGGSTQYSKQIMQTFELTYEGQEKTMIRFVVGSDGQVIEDSITNLDKSLRAGWKE